MPGMHTGNMAFFYEILENRYTPQPFFDEYVTNIHLASECFKPKFPVRDNW